MINETKRRMPVGLTVFALLLASLIILASCSDVQGNTAETTEAATAAVAAEETTASIYDEDGYIRDKLPEKLDLGGIEVHTLYDNLVQMPDFFVECENGEAVNDAIFKRNTRTEERLGVKLEFTGVKGTDKQDIYLEAAMADYSGGENKFAVYGAASRTIPYVSVKGILKDLLDSEYFSAEMPWWPSSLTDQLIINGKLLMCSGDISTMTLWQMSGLYYNKEIWENGAKGYSLEDVVESGDWTVDKMMEITSDFYIDDGDGVVNALDQFGFTCYDASFDAFLNSAGIVSIDKNGEGKLALTDEFSGEKTENLVNKLGEFCKDKGTFHSDTQKTARGQFYSGKSLFILDGVYVVSNKISGTSIEFNYGLVPTPKYDKDQERYITGMRYSYMMYAVNAGSSISNEAVAVLEAQGSYGYRLVVPQIFEVTMKLRYSQDNQGARMFDILREGVCFDIGRIYNYSMNNFYPNFRKYCFNATPGWTRFIKSLSGSLPGQLESIAAIYK